MSEQSEQVPQEQMMGAIAYFLGPITGLYFLVTEGKNAFIRFHAMQSLILFGGIIALQIVLRLLPVLGPMLLMMISPLLYIGSFVVWLVLMWKAYHGEKYLIPYIGELAEKQVAKHS